MARSVIYKIRSMATGREYVGSAGDFGLRKNVHLSQLRRGVHHAIKLQRHFNKYGEGDLVFDILEDIQNRELLVGREQFYIDSANPYFNSCPLASSCLGVKHSEESKARRKHLKNRLGKKNTPEQREKSSQAQIKRFQKPEERERARLRAIGNTHKRGTHISQAQILSMVGENSVNCKLSDDQIREIRSSHIPRHRDFSTRALARKYGVSHQLVSKVVHLKERKYVI